MKSLFLYFVLILVSVKAHGALGLSLEFGAGEVELDSEYSIKDKDERIKPANFGLVLEYRSHNKINYGLGGNLNLVNVIGFADRFRFTNIEAQISRDFRDSRGIFISPKFGFAKWELSNGEKQLFNPGQERKINARGIDKFMGVDFGFSKESGSGYYLSIKQVDYEFGKAMLYSIGIQKSTI